MNLSITIALIDLVLVTFLTIRKFDVRLVLFLGAIPLFLTAGTMNAMLAKMAAEMSNIGTVVPICSSLGFAYILRLTECDKHLVNMLLRPIDKMRGLLIPGGIAAGYLVNTTIVSQTGAAAVLGPILIPLLLAGGLSRTTAGAILLLGCSMGGELFNPAAVEMRKLAELTDLSGIEVVRRSTSLNLLACGSALAAFWLLAVRRQRRLAMAASTPTDDKPDITADLSFNPIKALIPIVPIVLLFLDSAIGEYSFLHTIQGPSKILAAMLIGCALAAVTTRGVLDKLAGSFFEGTGYAYTHVISLIVVASTFAEGIRISGLIALVVRGLIGWPRLMLLAGTLAPWALAVISGTGIAPAVSVMEFLIPSSSKIGIDPVRMGTLVALGSHFGRTMSPAAAVVVMSAKLAASPATSLIREVIPALLVGGAVMLAATLLGVL